MITETKRKKMKHYLELIEARKEDLVEEKAEDVVAFGWDHVVNNDKVINYCYQVVDGYICDEERPIEHLSRPEFVRRLRMRGFTFGQIGEFLGINYQAAYYLYSRICKK